MLLGGQGVFSRIGEVSDFDGEGFRRQKHEHILIRGIVAYSQDEVVVVLSCPPSGFHAFVIVGGLDFDDLVPVHDLEAEPGAGADHRVRKLFKPQIRQPVIHLPVVPNQGGFLFLNH